MSIKEGGKIMDIFTSINTALGIAKELKKWSDTIQNLEVKMMVSDLLSEMADIKVECASLKTESIKYEERIVELQKQLTVKESVEYDDKRYKYGFYYSKEDAEKNQPYCPRCYEKDKELIHLISHKPKHGGHSFECIQCKAHFTIESVSMHLNIGR